MQLEPRPEQVLRVSARLITSSTILQLSADELERAVNQEQVDNPALEVNEKRVCQFCGTRLYGQTCTTCGRTTQTTQAVSEVAINYKTPVDPLWSTHQQFYDFDNYGFAEIDRDDAFDMLASISTGETLTELLLRQLATLITPDDELIAEQLVGNLNERGYLEMSTDEIANHLQVPIERVEYVLSQLQTLEPPGIGARNLRECLLIQLQVLSAQEDLHPLASMLIESYLERLGRGQFAEIARELKVAEQEVRQASLSIRSKLYPFPAHTYRVDTLYPRLGKTDATYIRPDIVIRKSETGFEVELVEAKRYAFSINTEQAISADSGAPPPEVQRYIHFQSDRARFFIDCVQRRWRTLGRVAELVVNYQSEFLQKGVRYLRPLTRAEVATRLNLDEGTVSRATANKYVLLPDGRLLPISDFFDGSLGVKDVLRELIASEDTQRRLSDEELASLMQARGIPMARRTVTKYREQLGIGSSRERG
ncbi:MAG: RNA polymerase factor sigma-54 [Ktedonobacteraceae bacterium]